MNTPTVSLPTDQSWPTIGCAPTSGFVKVIFDEPVRIVTDWGCEQHIPIAMVYHRPTQYGHEMRANARLIAEAFNVAEETGMTPVQLRDKVGQLKAMVESLRMHLLDARD